MGGFVRGDVVVSYYPYTDLSDAKKRPSLVVAPSTGADIVLCEITSQPPPDRYGIAIAQADFLTGSLMKPSYVRANRFFTADSLLVEYRVDKLKQGKVDEVLAKIALLYDFKLR